MGVSVINWIKWIDERGCLRIGKFIYKAGDLIPCEFLSKKRTEYLLSISKIKIEKEIIETEEVDDVVDEVEEPVDIVDYGKDIVSKIIGKKRGRKRKNEC